MPLQLPHLKVPLSSHPGKQDAQSHRQEGAKDHSPLLGQTERNRVRPEPEEPDCLPEKGNNHLWIDAARKVGQTEDAVPVVEDQVVGELMGHHHRICVSAQHVDPGARRKRHPPSRSTVPAAEERPQPGKTRPPAFG